MVLSHVAFRRRNQALEDKRALDALRREEGLAKARLEFGANIFERPNKKAVINVRRKADREDTRRVKRAMMKNVVRAKQQRTAYYRAAAERKAGPAARERRDLVAIGAAELVDAVEDFLDVAGIDPRVAFAAQGGVKAGVIGAIGYRIAAAVTGKLAKLSTAVATAFVGYVLRLAGLAPGKSLAGTAASVSLKYMPLINAWMARTKGVRLKAFVEDLVRAVVDMSVVERGVMKAVNGFVKTYVDRPYVSAGGPGVMCSVCSRACRDSPLCVRALRQPCGGVSTEKMRIVALRALEGLDKVVRGTTDGRMNLTQALRRALTSNIPLPRAAGSYALSFAGMVGLGKGALRLGSALQTLIVTRAREYGLRVDPDRLTKTMRTHGDALDDFLVGRRTDASVLPFLADVLAMLDAAQLAQNVAYAGGEALCAFCKKTYAGCTAGAGRGNGKGN